MSAVITEGNEAIDEGYIRLNYCRCWSDLETVKLYGYRDLVYVNMNVDCLSFLERPAILQLLQQRMETFAADGYQ
jgi:hypothetical protein